MQSEEADSVLVQGRRIVADDLAWIAQYVREHPQQRRKAIARALCEHWAWRNGRGHAKEMAARSLLNKLAARGLVSLPPVRSWVRRQVAVGRGAAERYEPREAIDGVLGDLRPVHVEPVEEGGSAWRIWAALLRHEHYLGLRVVGENIGYLAQDGQGRPVAALLFGAAAWRCSARDRHLGWNERARAENLARLVNNTRFLVPAWVRVPHLASHVLGVVQRRIERDWLAKYAHGLDGLETFVDVARFRGTCYLAAGWVCVGHTQGRGRQDRQHQAQAGRKAVLLYDLASRRRRRAQ